jgi:hypothetical protein
MSTLSISNALSDAYHWVVDNSGTPPTSIVGNDPITGDAPPPNGLPAVFSVTIASGNADVTGGITVTGGAVKVVGSAVDALMASIRSQAQDDGLSAASAPGDYGDPMETDSGASDFGAVDDFGGVDDSGNIDDTGGVDQGDEGGMYA